MSDYYRAYMQRVAAAQLRARQQRVETAEQLKPPLSTEAVKAATVARNALPPITAALVADTLTFWSGQSWHGEGKRLRELIAEVHTLAGQLGQEAS